MRYAAIGDSFTEGVGDEQADGSTRGWADLVAAGLASATGESVQYTNFAIRGRLLEPIVTTQLDAALALDPPPTLLTFNGGGNDMMRPRADLGRLTAMTEHAVRRCVDAGVRLVLLSGADPSARLPFGRMIHRRGVALTESAAALAERYDIVFVDMFNDQEIRRPGYWSADRLHLNADGHRRVASRILAALGHPTTAHAIEAAPIGARDVRAEARFYREHVLPWVRRRLQGNSSGDNLVAKHVTWTPVTAT